MFERQAKEGAESFLHQTPENGKEQIIFIGSEVATLRLFREWVGLGYEIYQCQTITGQYAFFMYLE